MLVPGLLSMVACGPDVLAGTACEQVVERTEALVRLPAFDSDSALGAMRAQGDTLRQGFIVVYREGPTEGDLQQLRDWHAHAWYPRPGEAWLEVSITLRQAQVVARSPRVDRVVPGVLALVCPS